MSEFTVPIEQTEFTITVRGGLLGHDREDSWESILRLVVASSEGFIDANLLGYAVSVDRTNGEAVARPIDILSTDMEAKT